MSNLRGRFREETSAEMASFSSSIAVDLLMAEEDVEGSLAHAEMLVKTGLLGQEDGESLVGGLREILAELRAGTWRPGLEHEDIHMAVEARLVSRLGDLGKRLHVARSRNDQVATACRLFTSRRLAEIDAALGELVGVLVSRIETDGSVLLPGYTHLQRGQPILLGHHLLAHAFPLLRDRERIRGAMVRNDRSPLGACALAGTPHAIDREATAATLGFPALVENAMDAVAARDHEQEAVAAGAICMGHLSRMAEELVLWSSSEFGFVRLGEAWTTGSSIMPQKRNPDAAELVRGKASSVLGHLVTLLSLTKGLPLAYNRDLQEDRAPLFAALLTTRDSLRVMAGMWGTLEVRRERFESELRGDPCLATEIADYLTTAGLPFRSAHEIVGKIVLECEESGRNLGDLTPDELVTHHPLLGEGISSLLDPRAAAERRTSRGGTCPAEIARQVALVKKSL